MFFSTELLLDFRKALRNIVKHDTILVRILNIRTQLKQNNYILIAERLLLTIARIIS